MIYGRMILLSSLLAASMWGQGQITQPVDENKLVTLPGNVRSAMNAANDRGAVADEFPLDHMLLQLRRSPEREQALDKLLAEQQDKSSPNYHAWLTPAEYGQRFGLAPEDITAITNWLEDHGFTVNSVFANAVMIDFSGTAGQVRAAFHTAIHRLEVKGEQHFANATDPQVPAALAPAIVGIVSLHDFKPHPMNKPRAGYTFNSGGSTYYAVTPSDLATIYNFTPLFKAGISGKGQTIVVIEDTNVYSTADWSTFRKTFGLSGYTSGSFTQVHPGGCTNPGVVAGNDSEAILDAEYASAAAPNAAIELASCADTSTTFGGLIALHNLINTSKPPALVSISYGECEAELGAGANASFNQTYKQAASEGVSVFVAAGDEGAASCDAGQMFASNGISVSGFASTPYNVAVGGTDFADSYEGTNSTYWNTSNNSVFGSAKSYIPEIPWNDSCASVLLANAYGYKTTYGIDGFCNSFTSFEYYLTTAAGSGGPSGCATGTPSISGVVSGSCAGYAKPSWQSGVKGIANDKVRDIPDVSLFAANGVWGHYFVFCWSDTANGGASCSGTPDTWSGAGGTSFSSPIWAGIQSLVNEKTGSRQGLPTPTYYKLAAAQYSGSSKTAIFHDVTLGDMDVPCYSSYNCYFGSGFIGVLSTSDNSYSPAYGTATGWDFATGIGTVNVANLVNNW